MQSDPLPVRTFFFCVLERRVLLLHSTGIAVDPSANGMGDWNRLRGELYVYLLR
jgi:hypothetical protein